MSNKQAAIGHVLRCFYTNIDIMKLYYVLLARKF